MLLLKNFDSMSSSMRPFQHSIIKTTSVFTILHLFKFAGIFLDLNLGKVFENLDLSQNVKLWSFSQKINFKKLEMVNLQKTIYAQMQKTNYKNFCFT